MRDSDLLRVLSVSSRVTSTEPFNVIEERARVWFSNTTEGLPNEKVGRLSQQIYASYTGPDKGLCIVPDYDVINNFENTSHENVVKEIKCACCEKNECICSELRKEVTNSTVPLNIPTSNAPQNQPIISSPIIKGQSLQRQRDGEGDFVQYNEYANRARKRQSLPIYGIDLVSSPGGDSRQHIRRAPIASYDSLYSEDENFYSNFANFDPKPSTSAPPTDSRTRRYKIYEEGEGGESNVMIRRAYRHGRTSASSKRTVHDNGGKVAVDSRLAFLCQEAGEEGGGVGGNQRQMPVVRRANSDGHKNVIKIYRSKKKNSSHHYHKRTVEEAAVKLRDIQLKDMKLELKSESNNSDNILFVSPAGYKVHTLKSRNPTPVSISPGSLLATPVIESCRVNGVRILPALERTNMCIDRSEGGISSIDGDDVDDVEMPNFQCKYDVNTTAGIPNWKLYNRKAFGISMSLYDQNPVTQKISGDPIADAFVICARKNNALMVVADGVNWGEKSKMAARCAIYGVTKFINEQLFGKNKHLITNTHKITQLLLQSLDSAQRTILRHGGGLTTLCATLIIPMAVCSTREDFYGRRRFVAITVNVGDSLAFVLSKRYGIREITTGSHDITCCRDVRDAGGALGPVKGNEPELNNLTCSLTFVDAGDIIFLTSDGISDNFDPVVTKLVSSMDAQEDTSKPQLTPEERHRYALKTMEQVIHEFELTTEGDYSAQELCREILQHVLVLTNEKRAVLENPKLYRKMKTKERERRDIKIKADLKSAPGKLDHATIIGYEIGVYHGNQDENYQLFGVN